MTRFKRTALAALLVMMAASLYGQSEVPVLSQRVTDFTNTLDFNQWKSLESSLKDFEDSTSTQIAVLLINTTQGGSLFDYAMQVFDKNKLGQHGKDNGILVVVAKDDHQIRIVVGYGLEGVLPDALCSQIIEREIKPYFRTNNFYEGLDAGVGAIAQAVAGEYHADERGKNAPLTSIILLLFFFGFLGAFVLPMLSSRRRALIGSGRSVYNSGWGWPYSGFGGGGGGFGGGSFGGGGGFSGGGGMSGGGGAGGSW